MGTTTFKASAFLMACLCTASFYAQDKPAKTPRKFGKTPVEVITCGTTQQEDLLKKNNPNRAGKQQFEKWLAPKVAVAKSKRLAMLKDNNTATIPVVVHVIHNGDPIGTNENIADGQILSQITVLNQDFRRAAGTPGHNTNPVGADAQIAFCMAQRDPNGLATTGIVRYGIGREEMWDMEDLEEVKRQTQWDPSKYFNIWVVNGITTGGIYLIYGYAQFPTDSTLDGLENTGMGTDADTDGVAIAFDCFGSKDIYPAGRYHETRNMGRTTTHEVGHYFGLRHIWGDEDNCTADDYCADTPIARTANQGCPTGLNSCPNSPGNDMIENYMDYTNDACLNIFTLDQKDRMTAVLQNSPRRSSLTTSDACTPGITYDNDGSLFINNLDTGCGSTFSPSLVLYNSGNNPITSATITYHVNSQNPATVSWTGNLTAGQQDIIQLPQLTLNEGTHTLHYSIATLNGTADQTPLNDAKSSQFKMNNFATDEIVVTIQTDDSGSEIIWAILDSNEEPVFSNVPIDVEPEGSDYTNNTLYTERIALPGDGCYTFLMIDMGFDGICCANGEGYYNIKTADGRLIAEGGEFAFVETFNFGIDTTLGIKDNDKKVSGIKVYPNPSNGILNIAVPNTLSLPESYTIFNNIGQVVGSGKVSTTAFTLDISGYSKGIYFIKLDVDGSSTTLKFIKN